MTQRTRWVRFEGPVLPAHRVALKSSQWTPLAFLGAMFRKPLVLQAKQLPDPLGGRASSICSGVAHGKSLRSWTIGHGPLPKWGFGDPSRTTERIIGRSILLADDPT